MNHESRYNIEAINSNGASSRCYIHPKQVLIGICPLCLNEKLLVLALEQAATAPKSGLYRRNQSGRRKTSVSSLNKVFLVFGSFLFNRRESNWSWKFEDSDQECASTSQDESFISIKFEENGVGSWEKGKNTKSKVSIEQCKMTTWNHSLKRETSSSNSISVIDHANMEIQLGKPHVSPRWQKKIGQFFHGNMWKRSGKANRPSLLLE